MQPRPVATESLPISCLSRWEQDGAESWKRVANQTTEEAEENHSEMP